MARLHQFNALMDGKKAVEKKDYTKAYQIAQKPDLFSGQDRTYQPLEDDGVRMPPESKKVQYKVDDILEMFRKPMSALLDAELTQDAANAKAVADVIVGDKVLIKSAPVTYLLRLEKQVVHIGTLIRALPVVDPTDDWTLNTDTGLMVSQPVKTNRSDKVLQVLVEWAPPSPEYKQEAKTHTYTKDVKVGEWTTIKLSGAITAVRKKELEDRQVELLAAVRSAREQANSISVTDEKAGKAIFDYLLA